MFERFMMILSKSELKFLLLLGLIPAFSVSCQWLRLNLVDSSQGLEMAMAQQTDITQDLHQNLKELNHAYDDFVPVLAQYLNELSEVVQEKRTANPLILKTTAEKLQNVQSTYQKLANNLEKINPKFSSESSKILIEIEQNLKDIGMIIEPFKNGLNQEEVTKVQKLLNFFEKRNVDPEYYGIYGPTTQEEVELFLAEKSKILALQIQQLTKLITPANSPSQANPNSTTNPEKITRENQILQAEKEKLAQELKQLKSSETSKNNFWIWLLMLTVIIAVVTWIYKNFRGVSDEEKSGSKPYNMTHNDMLTIEEDIYELVSREFTTRFQNMESRLKQLEEKLPEKKAYRTSSNSGISNPQEVLLSIADDHFPTPQIKNPYDEIIKIYHTNPHLLTKNAIVVTDKENQQGNAIDRIYQAVYFEPSPQGNYWILPGGNWYYIIPKANFQLTEENYQSLQILYECYGYKPGESRQLKLLQPARVSYNEELQQWEFIQSGILECHSDLAILNES